MVDSTIIIVCLKIFLVPFILYYCRSSFSNKQSIRRTGIIGLFQFFYRLGIMIEQTPKSVEIGQK